MKKINLKTNQIDSKNERKGGTGSILIGVFLLLIVSGLYGWVYYKNKTVEQDIVIFENKIKEKKKAIREIDFKDTYNFEKRLLALKDQMAIFINQNSSLNKISAATFSETMFNSLDVNRDGIVEKYTINLTVPDLVSLVKQVKSFELITNINDLDFSGIAFDENGVTTEITFDILMSLDPENS